jgi:hypothetical protein
MPRASTGPQLCAVKNDFVMATVFFVVVMLHLLAGFGYALYRLGGSGKPGDTDRHENQSGTAV